MRSFVCEGASDTTQHVGSAPKPLRAMSTPPRHESRPRLPDSRQLEPASVPRRQRETARDLENGHLAAHPTARVGGPGCRGCRGLTLGRRHSSKQFLHCQLRHGLPRCPGRRVEVRFEDVGKLAVLVLVKSAVRRNHLVLDAEVPGLLEDEEAEEHVGCGPAADHQQPKKRPSESNPRQPVVGVVEDPTHAVLVERGFLVHGKESNGDNTPGASPKVHSPCVDRVIDPARADDLGPAVVDDAADEANQPGCPRVHRVGAGANGHHPRNRPVAHLHQRPVLLAGDVVEQHCGEPAARGREDCVDHRQ
eukprot:m.3812 g.3812  ORF g.3812 m.3812 type:complete len:306 (-) comp2577_c0_seq1:44-961(-)